MTGTTQRFLDGVVSAACIELQARAVPLFTFAFYHDHESGAVSVCADTESNSDRVVQDMNRWTLPHFREAVSLGDLRAASLWQANIGHSLALGDFAVVNLCRRDIPDITIDDGFYVEMIRSVFKHEAQLVVLAPKPDRLLFCCSSATDEAGFCWCSDSIPGAA